MSQGKELQLTATDTLLTGDVGAGSSGSGLDYHIIPQASETELTDEEDCSVVGEEQLLRTQSNDAHHASMLSSIANLTNTILGAGMLGLPAAFAESGYVLGSLLLLLAAASSAFALYFLSACASKTGLPSSFFTVANRAVPRFTFVIDLAVAIKCFGVATSYLIVIGDLMPSAIDHMAPLAASVWTSRRLWILIGFTCCAPLAVLKQLDSLKFTSALSVMFVVFLTAIVVAYAVPGSALDPCEGLDKSEGRCTGQASLVKFDLRTFKALPVFIFGFTCQQNIFSVTNELNNTSTSRMCIVIVVSIGISLIIYLAVASSGYTTYGPMVQSDILNSYPQTVLLTACRVCVSLLVAFSYPLQTHPSRSSALALWTVLRGAEPADRLCSRFSIATCLIVALSLVVAFTVEDLGTILALVGATGSTMVSYILPGICYYVLHKQTEPQHWKTNLALAQFVVGCIIVPLSLVLIFF